MALPWGRRAWGFPADALEINHPLIGTFAAKNKKSDVPDVQINRNVSAQNDPLLRAHDFSFFFPILRFYTAVSNVGPSG